MFSALGISTRVLASYAVIFNFGHFLIAPLRASNPHELSYVIGAWGFIIPVSHGMIVTNSSAFQLQGPMFSILRENVVTQFPLLSCKGGAKHLDQVQKCAEMPSPYIISFIF